jgi:predicted Zn-dependent peptidase
VGDFNRDSILTLAKGLRAGIVLPLTSFQRKQADSLSLEINKALQIWGPLGPTKTEKDFGRVRLYQGPESLTKESAAFNILSQVLGDAVSAMNREKQNLGYAHGGGMFPGKKYAKMLFYGGITGDEERDGLTQHKLMAEGWDKVIRELADGNYVGEGLATDELIEDAKRALLSQFEILPLDQKSALEKIFVPFLSTKDPKTIERMKALYKEVTVADVRAVAKKYLQSQTFLDVSVSKTKRGPCAKALSDLTKIRRTLAN